MLLTVFCLRRDRSELTFSLQVDADFELQNFRALCELESGIPAAESQIVYAERPLTDNHRSLASYGLKDGDVVILQQMENPEARPPGLFPNLPRIDFSSISVPGPSSVPAPQPPEPPAQPSPPELPNSLHGLDNPALLRDMLLANPHELSLLKERNPPLAEALLSGDLERFTRVLVEQQQDRARREQERIRLFSADPFDLEAQAKIEEDIRQQNIEENMTIAMEEAPESFGQVVMLYINCKVNGHPVKAFVDSGAQMTIMSQACAERCNIMRLVDRRWAGIAKGVGTQKIIGRVHLAQVQIEGDFLPCSFSILEEQPMDMLLGLDMLKRHQCSIDLKKNVLVIGTTGSQTSFLPEGELPECARLAYGAGREDMRPEEMADRELAEALQKSVEEAENSDKETTSLETPSVPTSDGLKHPVGLPEVGPQTNDPASRQLDCPVSAPPPPPESCLAETVNPQAAKPADSLHELPATLESKALLPSLRSLPEHVASSANVGASLAEDAGKTPCHDGRRLHPPNLSEKAIVWGSLCDSDDAQYDALDAEPPDGLRGQGTSSPNTHSQAEELDVPLLMEHAEEPHTDLLKTRTKTKREQDEPGSGEHLCPMALSPLAAPMELSPEDFFSEGSAGTEWERGISPAEKRRPEEVGREHGGGGISVEVAKEPFVATDSLLSRPGATQPGADAECSRMEVDTSVHPPPLPISSPPARDLTQREVPAVESTGVAGLVDPPPSQGQLSNQAEDPCISLTSALKELHQLLIVNSKQDSNVSQQEDLTHSTSAPQEQAMGPEVHQEDREPTYLDSPAVPHSFPGYTGAESSVKRQVFEAESTCVMERHRLAVSHEQDMLTVQETSTVDTSGFLSLPGFSSQAQAGEHVEEIFSQCPSSNHVLSSEASEQSQPPPPPTSLLQSPSRSSFSENMETSEALGTDFQRLMNELLDSSPPLPHDCPQLPISHAEDVDHLVGAGFAPQEATEALERAGGNVELALLILLAKNIVVPT